MEKYWEAHKVFFIATLALFPDKLNDHEVNHWFYRPYFVGNDLDFIELELEEYRKAGYLQFKKVHGLYVVNEINSEKAVKDLTAYLKKWQNNELLSLSADKPPDPAHQQALLLNAVTLATATQKEPRISLQDVYGDPNDYAYKPPFWELVLSYELLDNKVKIKFMDYDRRVDGLYDDNAQPFVEFKIADPGLIDLIKQRHTQTDKLEVPKTPSSKQSLKATVVIMDNTVHVALDDGTEYRISGQLRTDMPPLKFINHLLHRPRTSISRHDIKEATGSSDITELVRRCGFSKPLKKIFFPDTTEQNVYFQPTPIINESQVKLLAEHKWDKTRKGGTT